MTIRKTEEVISDLKALIASKGYIYSLCLILFEDFHHNLDKIHLVDPRSKLSVKECSLILGFILQNEIDFSTPESPEKVIDLKEKTYAIMDELHFSFSAPHMNRLKEMFESQEKGKILEDSPEEKQEFFVREGGLIEPTFYAGDGVYDFQYLEYLERKYHYDGAWLSAKRNFKFKEVCQIVSSIRSILQEKSKSVNLVGLKDVFPAILQKARKILKKQYYTKEQIAQLEREQFISASFAQYRSLFPPVRNVHKDNSGDWVIFYQNLLDLFVIRRLDVEPELGIDSFLLNFSISPGSNKAYNGPGYFNVLNSRPLIKLDDDRYFAPINYLISEAVYESPFYWMWEDESYRPKLAKHRGDVGEEIAYDLLSKVFGTENTFKSVLVSTKKGQPETDIDVVCLLGKKALCVQVKSKKLTLSAKRGDLKQLKADFKGAVQDAYEQGLVSRKAILEGRASFRNLDGFEIEALKEGIDEVYIMGLTTENYPSLVHQINIMLSKDEKDPFPLFISIFDLELLVHYLPDPYDFLYYVRQRVALIDYFYADEELVYLGYHLRRKLCKLDGYDGGTLDTDFGALIDRNYYPYKTGTAHLLSTKNDPIHNRWKGPKFEILLSHIKESKHRNAADIIFHLMDWSGQSREDFVGYMIEYKKASSKEGDQKSLATATAPEFGLSYNVIESVDLGELKEAVEFYSVLRKYKSKCDAWLGLGTFASSPNLIDFIFYLKEPWKFDDDLEAGTEDFFNQQNARKILSLTDGKKIGRNEFCPCNSGLKYKRCCGLN